jgi:hypothetical protein
MAKNHTKTLDNLIYRLNFIATDFRLGKTTLFEHVYQIFAVKRAIQPCSNFPDCTVVSHGCIVIDVEKHQ